MDFTKLLSILAKEALFFPTVELLRRIDPWEGSWSNANFHEYIGGTPESQRDIRNLLFSKLSKINTKRVCVSCWHTSSYESAAMWKLYIAGNEGIAIQTTFGKLRDSFQFENPSWPKWGDHFQGKKIPLIGCEVEYIDWNNPPENTHVLKQYIYKGRSFEHEHELRIIAQLCGDIGMPPYTRDAQGKIVEDETLGLTPEVLDQVEEQGGVYFPVNVKLLIENIFIAPTSPHWFTELVEKVIKGYGFSTKPKWSNQLPRY